MTEPEGVLVMKAYGHKYSTVQFSCVITVVEIKKKFKAWFTLYTPANI
jgi:hypothetical protein